MRGHQPRPPSHTSPTRVHTVLPNEDVFSTSVGSGSSSPPSAAGTSQVLGLKITEGFHGLAETIAAFEKAAQRQLNTLAEEANQHRADNKKLVSRNEKLTARNEKLVARNEALAARNAQLAARNESLTETLVRMRCKVDELKRQLRIDGSDDDDSE